MSSVLGVSVGAGTIRLARPDNGTAQHHATTQHNGAPRQRAPHAGVETIAVPEHQVEQAAAAAIAGTIGAANGIAATAITFRDDAQARAIRAAMAAQQLTNYQLVPEGLAACQFAHATEDLRDVSTLAVYDFGRTGLTVSVVNARTGDLRHTERINDVSGDYLDTLVREQQIASGRISHPPTPAGLAALDELCRSAKEQLSDTTAVALPSDQGLILLARENFEALIQLAVESSARTARDAILRSRYPVQAVLVIGGGARIPSVAETLEHTIGVPVIVPPEPESVLARGAAMLARPVRPQPTPEPAVADGEVETPAWLTEPARRPQKTQRSTEEPDSRKPLGTLSRRSNHSRRELNGAVLTVSALVVVSAIGLGLGYGPQVLERGAQSPDDSASESETEAPRTSSLNPYIAVPPTEIPPESVHRTASPPVAPVDPGPAEETSQAPAPDHNTFTVVPGLPPVVLPTIPGL